MQCIKPVVVVSQPRRAVKVRDSAYTTPYIDVRRLNCGVMLEVGENKRLLEVFEALTNFFLSLSPWYSCRLRPLQSPLSLDM